MTAPEISMTATGNLHLGGAIVNINGILIINGSPYLA
jgi:hypothetical protein